MTVIQEGKLRFFFPEEWQVIKSGIFCRTSRGNPLWLPLI